MRITGAGNVGIGTSSVEDFSGGHVTLEVAGSTTSQGGVFKTATSDSAGSGSAGTEMIMFTDSTNGGSVNVVSSDALRLMTANTARMTITSGGDVGIGLNNPARNLHISDSGTPTIRLQDTGGTNQYAELFVNSSSVILQVRNDAADGSIIFRGLGGAVATERMRIDPSGNLLVGKTTTGYTTPGVRLAGQGYASNFAHNTAGQTNVLFSAPVSEAQVSFYRQDTGAGMGSITNGATNSVSYNTSSDYRLKEDWQPMSGSVDRVKALNPVNFAWKIDGSRVDGFLAHEAQTVVPEAVTGTHNEVDNEGNPVYQGIDQSKLVPLLTAALQEALTKIETLEARVTALES
jgi:hypothetical protein